MGKAKLFLPLAALLLAACNILPGLQPKPFTGALDLPSPLQTVAPGGQVQVPVRATFNDSRVASVTLTVRLADPCAKGTSYCPGWDTSRYPGVTHPTESHTLTPASPSVTLTFQVDPGALSQGPFKYELVLSGQDASANPREEVVPFYLKVLAPGERSGMEAWNFWRDYLGLPRVREDPEWSFRAWLHSRYRMMNYPNGLSHDEDLSQPFASLEGREAGRRGNEWVTWFRRNGQPYWPAEEASINWWIAAPFHRLNMIDPRAVNGPGGERGLWGVQGRGTCAGIGGRIWAHLGQPAQPLRGEPGDPPSGLSRSRQGRVSESLQGPGKPQPHRPLL